MCEKCAEKMAVFEKRIDDAWAEAQIKRELIGDEYNTLKDKLHIEMRAVIDNCPDYPKKKVRNNVI